VLAKIDFMFFNFTRNKLVSFQFGEKKVLKIFILHLSELG